jgi:hypothetical protein
MDTDVNMDKDMAMGTVMDMDMDIGTKSPYNDLPVDYELCQLT